MKFLGAVALLVSLSALASAAPAANEPSAVGLWEQVDDKTGKPESWLLRVPFAFTSNPEIEPNVPSSGFET